MKKIIVYTVLVLASHKVMSQKSNLELDSYRSWTEVRDGHISDDGKYVYYQIENSSIAKSTFVVCSVDGKFRKEFLTDNQPKFSADSRFFIGKLQNDTLLILDLKNKSSRKLHDVTSFKLIQNERYNLAYIQNRSSFVLQSLNSDEKLTYPNVIDYKFSNSGDKILLKQTEAHNQKDSEVLNYIDVRNKSQRIIFEGSGVKNIIFNDDGDQVAFFVNRNQQNEIWHYKEGTDKPIIKVRSSDFTDSLIKGIAAGVYWRFSKDGNRLFFSVIKKVVPDTHPENNLEIWNYQDACLRSYWYGKYLDGGDNIQPKEYLSVVNISNGKIKQLITGDQRVLGESFRHETDTIFLVASSFGDINESWNKRSKPSYYICHTSTGQLKLLEKNLDFYLSSISLSPSGKYIAYFNPQENGYFSYNIASERKTRLTIEDTWICYDMKQYPRAKSMVVGITGWSASDEKILINGTYDIWLVDPLNEMPAVNLTLGYGMKNETVFYPITATINGKNGKMMVSSFNLKNKNYGFYEVNLKHTPYLKKLFAGQVFLRAAENVYNEPFTDEFIKAKESDSYLIRFENTDKAPNYFYSKDLKQFSSLSNEQPHKKFNWLTSELHTYKDSTNNTYQGVLYKPENFDSTKKYPVVFLYYIEKSNLLNSYPKVEPAGSNVDVALMVSNGYLVFLPDIKSVPMYSGEGAISSLNAAADHLCTYRWVEGNKMAVVGGSFGGFETNYIITHTKRFAAAISCAGISDMVSFASGVWGWGDSQQGFAQYTALKMAAPLGDDPETYIRNSPILQASNVKTPLLLLHNEKDTQVSFLQSRSFFVVLRNLQKKVWWLNYKTEGHGNTDQTNVLDYSIKSRQFLDHYLKDKPMPEWMKTHL